ncbi:MAG: DUF4355 domain-containing protein [Aerococcus sp.]|nr:DUF4355 domain-containing protein [Aerococcus sp.]
MERKFLEELGLEKETVNQIMSEYGKSIQQYKDSASSTLELQQKVNELETANRALESAATERQAKFEDLNQQLSKANLDNMRTRVALEQGLPYSLADRLRGEDEDALTKDAQSLSQMVNRGNDPLRSTEPSKPQNPYLTLAQNLGNGEGEN